MIRSISKILGELPSIAKTQELITRDLNNITLEMIEQRAALLSKRNAIRQKIKLQLRRMNDAKN